MKKKEAEALIRIEYINWKASPQNIKTSDPKYEFFGWLQKNKPYLLNFRYSGSDKWQCVYSMLSGL